MNEKIEKAKEFIAQVRATHADNGEFLLNTPQIRARLCAGI